MDTEDLDRFRRARELFARAVELPPDARASFLEAHCAGDGELRREVEALLALDAPDGEAARGAIAEAARDLLADFPGPNGASAASAAPSLAPGDRVSHFVVDSQLGRGGMGEVYLAHDLKLGRRVALKLLPSHFTEDPDRSARFRREARALAALNHPGIVTLHSIDEFEGAPVLTMEWIEGTLLRHEIPGGGMELERFAQLALELAEALAYAHRHGVMHRDLKPDNVMLTAEGRIKILDFGLAKWMRGGPGPAAADLSHPTRDSTVAGALLGTASYMSPEQVEGRAVDLRSDVFSLGCLLYEMLSGRRAFGGDSTPSILAAVLRDRPEPLRRLRPEAPIGLVEIVERCLEKAADARWSDGGAVHRALLAQATASVPGIERRPSGPPETANPSKRSSAVGEPEQMAPKAGGPSGRRAGSAGRSVRGIGISSRAALAVAILLAVGGWAIWRLVGLREVAAGRSVESLAVLPFQDFSADREPYLVDGLTAALITELSKIETLRVISHTSVLPFRERTESLPAIAERLGVEAVLEGSVVREGDRLALSVNLVRARNERTLWSGSFEEELRDVLILNRTIASEVASEVLAVVKPADRARLGEPPTLVPRAYESMLRGTYLWNRLDRERALSLLREAIEIDPRFALGWATLSDAYLQLANDDPSFVPMARAAAERAVELDPDLAEARTTLGAIALYFDWEWATAERELERALRLNPGYDQAHQIYGDYLEFLGRWDDAIAEGVRSTAVNPTSVAMLMNLGITYVFAGRYAEAERTCETARQLEPKYFMAHRCLAEALAGQGKRDAARAALEAAVALAPDDQALMAQQAILYAGWGRSDRAREVARRLEGLRAAGVYVSPLIEGMVHMALGETRVALDRLEVAVEEKAPWTPGISAWPYFDPLRGEPRFEELVRRVGLPQAEAQRP